ncbi:MAG: hypothetical protein IJ730_00755 [Alphaproteobacteria bacterium]|nr:hypothetical protein [Alphaproteobacteria bacterium]
MKSNLVAKNSKLDHLIDFLGIADSETDMPPILSEDRAMVKLELLCAQALVRDVLEISKKDSEKQTHKQLLDQLSENIIEQIKTIAEILLRNPNFQFDIINELIKLNRKI